MAEEDPSAPAATGPIEPTLPLHMPRDARPATRAAAPRRPRPVPVPVQAPASDLFGGPPEPPPAPAPRPGQRPGRRQAKAPVANTPDADAPAVPKRRGGRKAAPLPDAAPPDTEAVAASDPEPVAAPAAAEPDPAEPAPAVQGEVPPRLHPDELLLQRVDPRSFRPGERGDSWLYWLTDRDRAQDALRDGLLIEPGETLLLSDRPAVLPQLAALAEDPDFAPAAIAVLRLKRIAVEPFLERGPRAACYVLTAEAKNRP